MSPILQDLAVKCTQKGSDPIVRPLYYADPYDQNTYNIDDQFMLGEDLLIAPVVLPMKQGKESRLKINTLIKFR